MSDSPRDALADLQSRFGALLDARSPAGAGEELFVAEPGGLAARIGLYRGNARANALKALAAAYPVTQRLVGEDFFGGLAREFEVACPSASGDLNEFGDRFADFLATFPHAATLPYLADVARMEWLVHRAHYSADARPFDPARLAVVPAGRQADLRPRMHPACALMHSAFPLARIWEIHQRDFAGPLELTDADPSGWLLVFRPRFRARVAPLGEGAAAFLACARGGGTLADALARARAVDAEFDLDSALREWVEAAVIVDFGLEEA
jgi:uncharacterized protein